MAVSKNSINISFSSNDSTQIKKALNLPNVRLAIVDGFGKSLRETLLEQLEKAGLPVKGSTELNLCLKGKINRVVKDSISEFMSKLDSAANIIEKNVSNAAKEEVAKIYNKKNFNKLDYEKKKDLIKTAIIKTVIKTTKSILSLKNPKVGTNPLSEMLDYIYKPGKKTGDKKLESTSEILDSLANSVEECYSDIKQDERDEIIKRTIKENKKLKAALKKLRTTTSKRIKSYSASVAELTGEAIEKFGYLEIDPNKKTVTIKFDEERYAANRQKLVSKELVARGKKKKEEEQAEAVEKPSLIYQIVHGTASTIIYGILAIVFTSIVFLLFKIPFKYIIDPRKWPEIFRKIANSDKHIVIKIVGFVLLAFGVVCAGIAIYRGAKALIAFLLDKIRKFRNKAEVKE